MVTLYLSLVESMADIKSIFGLVLKQARNEKGISQEHLALESGLDRSYISKLEVGNYQPSISTIFEISEVLEVRPDELVREVYERYLDSKNKKKTSRTSN